MELSDIRRLTGANLIMNRPGAAGEADLPPGDEGYIAALWRRQARRMLDAVGWSQSITAIRPFQGGASLAVSAPIDGLYAATEIVEWAWEEARALWDGAAVSELEPAAVAIRANIAEERNPALVAIEAAARARGVVFLHGEDRASVGLGTGCQAWPDDALPTVDDIDWDRVHDIPVGLVTGTNGKSTTVRLTAAIGAATGRIVGLCSSDWVRVGGEIVDEGDYSGPGGARRAVRDSRADLAVLEVARGGLLRRGLTIPRVRACLITNVAVDHLGEYGVMDLAGLTEAKFLPARSVEPGGRLILNADDPQLVRHGMAFDGEITWVSLSPDSEFMAAWLASGGEAAVLAEDQLVLARGQERIPVLEVADFPIGLNGAARFNLSNALGAIALADVLGLPVAAMAEGLAKFSGGPEDNPGRGNFIDLGGVTVLVDFAHNPHGVAALIDGIRHLPARRRLFLLGQAGDRRDEDIRDLARIVWDARPDRILVKEMAKALRGREAGEVPELIAQELDSLGAPRDVVGSADSELDGLRQALEWAEEGDLLVLLLHTDRKEALGKLVELRDRGWQAGMPIDIDD
ncbi:MAG: Mur ligase [Alphaproteobacteria bacterium]|nr:Mur ligase [Alphaproteobacteria bacterium]